MLVPSKQFLLGSALLLAALPALANEESSGGVAPVSSMPHASINCPGIPSVPMTADQEQALPMRLVASLSCGENVTVLADNEGYTARIRTNAGTEGYVARMYLVHESIAPPAPIPVVPNAATVNGVVRWQAGAPGCEQLLSWGRHVESVTANGVTVQVSLQDSGWKFRVNVAVSNHGDSTVDVLPTLVSLDELQPSLKPLLPQSPSKLQHVTNHQVFWTAATAQPSPSAVAQNSDHVATVSSLVYHAPATPDYLGLNPFSDSKPKHAIPGTETEDVGARSLKAVSLATGEQTSGVLWFERDPDARELSLRLAVGDLIFDFPLSFEQKK